MTTTTDHHCTCEDPSGFGTWVWIVPGEVRVFRCEDCGGTLRTDRMGVAR